LEEYIKYTLVENNMQLTKKEIIELLRRYDLGTFLSYKKAKMGVANHNWIIRTTTGKFVLRCVSRFKKLKEIKFELKYLNFFRKSHFQYKIPKPLKNNISRYITKFRGGYFWVYPFIEGKIILRFGRSELKELAKVMAEYHSILEKSKLDNSRHQNIPFNRIAILKELKQFKNLCSKKKKKEKKDKIYLLEVDELIGILESLDPTIYLKLKAYPIHRDINPENIVFKKKKVIGLIDFDNVSFMDEPLVKDIAILLMYSCRTLTNESKLNLKLSKFFIKEYQKYHKLTLDEIKLIPDLIIAGAIEDFSYVFWLFENDPERVKLKWLKLYSKLAKWITKNKKYIIEFLSK